MARKKINSRNKKTQRQKQIVPLNRVIPVLSLQEKNIKATVKFSENPIDQFTLKDFEKSLKNCNILLDYEQYQQFQ